MAYEEKYMVPERRQSLSLDNREHLTVNGVGGVESFDEAVVVMNTVAGDLIVRGTDLKIDELSLESGNLSITGKISALEYDDDPGEERGFFARLLR
jgi:sporulation protein YabP